MKLIFRILSVLTFMMVHFYAQAIDIEVHYNYKINSSLETTNKEFIRPGERVKLVNISPGNGWFVEVRRLDERLQPYGPVHRVSKHWFGLSAEDVTIDDIVSLVEMGMGASPGDEIEETCPEGISLGSIRPKARPTWIEEEAASSAPLTSLRPIPRPVDLVESYTPTSDFFFKEEEHLDQYFACYQRDVGRIADYQNKYKRSIERASRGIARTARSNGDNIDEDQFASLLSCLIFRESSHFVGRSSPTGAVGLGQFTGTAINEVKSIIDYRYRSRQSIEERVQTQRNERTAGRLTSSELSKNLSIIDAERRVKERKEELQDYWNSLPLSSRPSASQLNDSYMGNNNNHEVVIALSAMMLRNCMIRLQEEVDNMNSSDLMLACAGAYNMGVGGFKDNAISRSGEQSVEAWVANLKKSGDRQANETIGHVISIKRCSEEGTNYPPCGTNSSYCSALPKADSCRLDPGLRCPGECN